MHRKHLAPLEVSTLRDSEKAMKIRLLQETLGKEFGINNRAELLQAVRRMTPVDISMCVTKPAGAVSFCSKVTKSHKCDIVLSKL